MIEIERKFLIKNIPEDINIKNYKHCKITQSYLNDDKDTYEIRIRKYEEDNIENRYYLDFKSIGKKHRNEFGLKIHKQLYEDILTKIKKQLIKTRYYYNDMFIDIYEGVLDGLITAEYESDENSVNNFIPPEWFDIEITDDDKYKNRYLANNLIK